MNISLLCKWWRKLEVEEGLWQKINRFKYLQSESICTVSHRQSDSPIWADLLKIKSVYLQGRKIEVRDGKNTFSWLDSWFYSKPLAIIFPDLSKICEQPRATVSQVKMDPSSITFTRWLVDDLRMNWDNIMKDIYDFQLVDDKDLVTWKLGEKGSFSVNSVYNALTSNYVSPYHKQVWKGRIPAKIKNFLWLVMNNAILTKDNLIKRKWVGSPQCHFCDEDETVSHLLFQCSMARAVWAVVAHSIKANNVPRSLQQCWAWCERWLPAGKKFHTSGIAAICWSIWRIRNSICFEGKKVSSPISIISMACSLMCYWSGLFLEADKDDLVAGANSMLAIALKLLNKKMLKQNPLLLKDDKEEDQDREA